jgi:hypothetical protein
MMHFTETEQMLRRMIAEAAKEVEDTWFRHSPETTYATPDIMFNNNTKMWRIELYKGPTFRATAPMLHQAVRDICTAITQHFNNIQQANFMLLEAPTYDEGEE